MTRWLLIGLLLIVAILCTWGAVAIWQRCLRKRVPGCPVDGLPLTDEEERALAGIRVATEAVDVPEPVYPRQDGAR